MSIDFEIQQSLFCVSTNCQTYSLRIDEFQKKSLWDL
jgi:hypothetical protein